MRKKIRRIRRLRLISFCAAVTFSLSALALGLVQLLFYWQVRPKLVANRTQQERFYPAFLEDQKALQASGLFQNMRKGTRDAGVVLNPKVYWKPRKIARGFGPSKTLVPVETREVLLRYKNEWMHKHARAAQFEVDLSIFNDVHNYDFWNIERNSPIAELIRQKRFFPPPQAPAPEVSDLLPLIKIRLMRAVETGDELQALKDVHQFGLLMLTTENTQLVLAGIAAFDDERTAYQYYVSEKKIDSHAWTPVSREILQRAYRSILATRNYLRLWTRPEKVETIFLNSQIPVGFCAAAAESLPLEFSLRRELEPKWIFEVDLRSDYKRLDTVMKRAQTNCRVEYLSELYREGLLRYPVPGPLFLTHLPYSRKIFGLRASLIAFSGFPGY